MWVSNSYVKPEASPVTVTFREVFRIEDRDTKKGVFCSPVMDNYWRAFQLPTPHGGAEAALGRFVDRHIRTSIFAYLSIKSIQYWFSESELEVLDQASLHVSVFLVSNEPGTSSFSSTQVVFVRDRAKWLRFISLLDL